jgi:hypothetical protein
MTTRPPRGLQLDLLSALVRLGQVADELDPAAEVPFPLDHVFSCDVPRLWAHLTPQTITWLRDSTGDLEPLLAHRERRRVALCWLGHAAWFAAGCIITAYFMSPPW